MKLYSIVLLALVASTPAFARITLFQNYQAAQHLLASTEFAEEMAKVKGELVSLEIQQRDESNAFQAFNFNAIVESKTPIGPRTCYISSDVFTIRDTQLAPAGITASKLSAPVVQPASCTK